VQQGEIFGLIGPNGAGKTTTMECIEGLRSRIGARSPCSDSIPPGIATRCKLRIGVQLQEAQLQKRIKGLGSGVVLGIAVPHAGGRAAA